MFRFTLISAALLGSVTSMKVNSSLGRELLSKSRNLDGEVDYSWMLDYSMKFARCHTVTQYGAVDGEDGNENGGTWQQTLVKYKLCPSNECGYGCSGGEYLTDMKDFVDLYTENEMTAKELACETTRENCVCNDDDEDTCMNTCYEAAEQDYCVETDDDGEEFNVQEYLECAVLENQNGNDNGSVYYVGPKCSENGQRINLGVFMDEFCTVAGPSAIYASYTGDTLPYAEESIVAENCVGCTVSGDDDAADELSGFCTDSYMSAVKCENNMNIYNPITNGCDYIHSIYLRDDSYNPVGHTWTLIAAWVFLSSTCILAVVAGKMHQAANQKILLNPSNAGAVV